MNLKKLIVILAIVAIIVGIVLVVFSGTSEEPAKQDLTENATIETTVSVSETTQSSGSASDGISATAQKLYAHRTEKIDDAEAVVKLLDVFNLEKNVADYVVELQTKGKPKAVKLIFKTQVASKDRIVFDKKMQKRAELILALIDDADEVQWSYDVTKKDNKKENVIVFLDEKTANSLLKYKIKNYGISEKAVQTLLDEQKKNK